MKLIDVNTPIEVDISGTKVVMRPMEFEDRSRLIMLMEQVNELREGGAGTKFIAALTKVKPEIDGILNKYVVSIDLPEVTEINNRLWSRVDYDDYVRLVMELFVVSGITRQAEKNLK